MWYFVQVYFISNFLRPEEVEDEIKPIEISHI